MNLRDVAAISGKPGIYRILKPTRNGVMIESISAEHKKDIVNAHERISILKEISMYITGGEEESTPLENVFSAVREKHGNEVKVNTSSAEDMKAFMAGVLPDYDRDRVYSSDIKKLITWYNALAKFYPEAMDAASDEEEQAAE